MDNNCIFINIRHWDTGNKGKLKHTSVFVIVFYTKYNFRFEMRNPRCTIVNTLWWNVQNTIFSWFSEPKQSFYFIMISEFNFLLHIKVWTFKMVSRSVWGMLKKTRRRAKKRYKGDAGQLDIYLSTRSIANGIISMTPGKSVYEEVWTLLKRSLTSKL